MDLNADMGEGFGSWSMGDDSALLEVVTSANVACGFHAGDPSIMRRVTAEAVERGVAIGAHVGYADKAGFGRRHVDIEPELLRDEVLYQIGALDAFARIAGDRVRYVKPHGALYNTIGHHLEQATAVVTAVAEYDRTLPVLGLPGSAWLRLAAEAGLDVVHEAFADRAYTASGTLVPRRETGSVLHDADE
ncbi:MAG: LamB/YcsF family protein, partial [Kribbellaceae bacterium]|nr:LamB/YcsF family protein [Kribbellaceae bacterium]